MTGSAFAIEERWPELFTDLDTTQRWAVVQSLAAAWHEGWVPSRADVALLTDHTRGVIDDAEYHRRVAEAAERQRQEHR
ncbi:antitoxin VbhA family protein [Propionicicella superfundia]|uniref:antitoxin VbhA family protein n=1 Tax=Propionicicella superfundia TaxID=348582 RepID=UPI000421B1FC|nr:antitoxin VbhA family protein [Propionicicella superfundia]